MFPCSLQKQQKKYGVDLSNILVSGSSDNTDAEAFAVEVEPTNTKKKGKTAKKVADKKPETKQKDNKIEIKKSKKKVESEGNSTNGKTLLEGLLNETYETDTSDDDFKIDHSFSASADETDESDGSSGDEDTFMNFLAPKLSAAFKNQKSTEISGASESEDIEDSDDVLESEDDIDSEDGVESDFDVESDEDEPEIVLRASKGKHNKNVTSNKAVDPPTKAGMKRKLKGNAEPVVSGQVTSNSKAAKKMKQDENKKKELVSSSKISVLETEASVATTKKKKQKHTRVEEATTTITASPSESVFLKPQTKQKKTKLTSDIGNASNSTSTATDSSGPATLNKKLKKKKTKRALNEKKSANASLTESTPSEPETPKQKQSKSKSKAENVSKPEVAAVKVDKEKLQPIHDKKVASNNTTPNSSEPENLKQKKKKKKNQPAKVEEINLKSTVTSSEPEFQNQKLKKKPKTVDASTAGDNFISLKAEPVNVETKKKKLKPVTSSLISDNGIGKRSVKSNIKSKLSEPTKESSAAWSTVSETDGEESKKQKTTGNPNLKTITRKNNSKKKNDTANLLNVKKVKQTPGELLHVVSPKSLKQNIALKSKKKKSK